MFICEEDMRCVDCPRNDATEYCCHWIEVESVKHGHWEQKEDKQYYCSACTNSIGYVIGLPLSKYCPNCGAKMKEVK